MSCSIQLNAEQAIVYYQHNGAIGKTNIIEKDYAIKRSLSDCVTL
jgi:hypothetical protein